MNFEVLVEPKPEVLDPEGRTIESMVKKVGFSDIKSVKVSKRYVVDVEATSTEQAYNYVETLARQHLANPVAECFKVNLVDTLNH